MPNYKIVWRVFCDAAEDVRTTLEQTGQIVQFKNFIVKISPTTDETPILWGVMLNEAVFQAA
jgi:hypothetical protein